MFLPAAWVPAGGRRRALCASMQPCPARRESPERRPPIRRRPHLPGQNTPKTLKKNNKNSTGLPGQIRPKVCASAHRMSRPPRRRTHDGGPACPGVPDPGQAPGQAAGTAESRGKAHLFMSSKEAVPVVPDDSRSFRQPPRLRPRRAKSGTTGTPGQAPRNASNSADFRCPGGAARPVPVPVLRDRPGGLPAVQCDRLHHDEPRPPHAGDALGADRPPRLLAGSLGSDEAGAP